MKWYITGLIILLNMFSSCNGQNLNKIINRLDKESFDKLEGVFISLRNKDRSSMTIMIDKYDIDCSPYVVTVNLSTKEVLSISDKLMDEECKGYLADTDIKILISEFLKHDVAVLGVDKDGNVYINPNKQEPPILLKKSDKSPPKDIDQFKLYKGNWYVKK